MNIDNTRYKVQKWYSNEREAETLESFCDVNDLTKSDFVRRIVMRAVRAQTNRMRRRSQREGPNLGLIAGFPFPARL